MENSERQITPPELNCEIDFVYIISFIALFRNKSERIVSGKTENSRLTYIPPRDAESGEVFP